MQRNVRWMVFALAISALITTIVILIVDVQKSRKLPCDYADSINITGGTYHSDKSIIFNGVKYPRNQYFNITYTLNNGEKTPTAKPYRRGCVCNIGLHCIRLCCPARVFYDNERLKCHNQTHEAATQLEHQILTKNNVKMKWTLDKHFAYIYEKPCKRMFIADENYYITQVYIKV